MSVCHDFSFPHLGICSGIFFSTAPIPHHCLHLPFIRLNQVLEIKNNHSLKMCKLNQTAYSVFKHSNDVKATPLNQTYDASCVSSEQSYR